MPVLITFAKGPAGNAAVEFNQAIAAAERAGDRAGREFLDFLFNEHIPDTLGRMSPRELLHHVANAAPWRREGAVEVFKTVDQPCFAYTAHDADGEVTLLVLGFCHRYPTTAEDWWRQVIRPRLMAYL